MFDLETEPKQLQRARGRAEVGFVLRQGQTRLKHLHQSGCAKAMLPQVPGAPEVVFLNTAGGLTGGDRLDYRVTLAEGTRATATTQTAERAYAAIRHAAPATVSCRMQVGAGAALDWLPQETILFEGSALERTTRIDLDAGARLLLCETLVFGRAAMGETLGRLSLLDRREIWREGQPVLVDAVRMDDASLTRPDAPAMLNGARAVALVALVADGAEDALGPVRDLLANTDVTAAASAWNGRCLVRLMAGDAWPLRRVLVALLTHLRGTAPPRVWQT